MAEFRVLWHSATHWAVVPNMPEFRDARSSPNGQLITAMSDGALWATINWSVQNMRLIYADECPMNEPTDVASKLWLRNQPVFEAMVVEAVQRGLSFEPATFDYLRRFVIDPRRQRGDIIGAPPWRDPVRLREQTRFRDFFKEQKQLKEDDENPSSRRVLDI